MTVMEGYRKLIDQNQDQVLDMLEQFKKMVENISDEMKLVQINSQQDFQGVAKSQSLMRTDLDRGLATIKSAEAKCDSMEQLGVFLREKLDEVMAVSH